MALPLTDLLAGSTTDETLATLVALGAVAGFPAYSWQSGSVPRTFFELEAVSYADLTQVIGAIAGGGFVDHAEGPWLTLRAAQGYNLTRQAAVYTQGPITLTDAGGIGPVDITDAGQVVVTVDGTRFRVVDSDAYPLPLTLPASGSVTAMFEAEAPGAAGNIPDGATVELVTSLPGVTAVQLTPSGGTWIAQQGADEESDAALRVRCKARWGELGYGATEAAYRYWASTASAEVTRVAVAIPYGDGHLTVYVAGSAGPISGGALTIVDNYIYARRPQCVTPAAVNATQVTVTLTGTVKVKAAQNAAAQAAASAALSALFAAIPIGGIVYRAPIEKAILDANIGVVNVALDNDPEQQLAPGEVAVVDVSGLTWTNLLWPTVMTTGSSRARLRRRHWPGPWARRGGCSGATSRTAGARAHARPPRPACRRSPRRTPWPPTRPSATPSSTPARRRPITARGWPRPSTATSTWARPPGSPQRHSPPPESSRCCTGRRGNGTRLARCGRGSGSPAPRPTAPRPTGTIRG